MSSSSIFLKFFGGNQKLLRIANLNGELHYPLTRHASIKDIIEALGIPHSEVGKIVLNGSELDFQFLPKGLERIEIHPFTRLIPVASPALPRPEPFSFLRFMVETISSCRCSWISLEATRSILRQWGHSVGAGT